MNLYCPCYFDELDQQVQGPHAFAYGENKLIFCMACGEIREMDPSKTLPSPPAPPQPAAAAPTVRQRSGNGILP